MSRSVFSTLGDVYRSYHPALIGFCKDEIIIQGRVHFRSLKIGPDRSRRRDEINVESLCCNLFMPSVFKDPKGRGKLFRSLDQVGAHFLASASSGSSEDEDKEERASLSESQDTEVSRGEALGQRLEGNWVLLSLILKHSLSDVAS